MFFSKKIIYKTPKLPQKPLTYFFNLPRFKLYNYQIVANTTIEHWAGGELERVEDTLKAQFSWDNIHPDMDSHAIIRFKVGDFGQKFGRGFRLVLGEILNESFKPNYS